MNFDGAHKAKARPGYFLILACMIFPRETRPCSDLCLFAETGKRQYVQNEPVYLKILIVNPTNQNVIVKGYPLSIGFGGYTLCANGPTGEHCRSDLSRDIDTVPIHGLHERQVLSAGTAHRYFGSPRYSIWKEILGQGQPGQYQLTVKRELIADGKRIRLTSMPIQLTIVRAASADSAVHEAWAGIRGFDFTDNPANSDPISNDAPLSRQADKAVLQTQIDSALSVLAANPHSPYAPYFLSGILLHYYPGNSGRKHPGNVRLLRKACESGRIFQSSDPFLRVRHAVRIRAYLAHSEWFGPDDRRSLRETALDLFQAGIRPRPGESILDASKSLLVLDERTVSHYFKKDD